MVFLYSFSKVLLLILLISLYKTFSPISRIILHSLIYTVLVIFSGITAMDRTISVIKLAFFTGSFFASCDKSRVLKVIKSSSFSSIYFTSSLALLLFANESGSSPSGNNKTRTLSPCSKTKSIPRNEALIPAASPS